MRKTLKRMLCVLQCLFLAVGAAKVSGAETLPEPDYGEIRQEETAAPGEDDLLFFDPAITDEAGRFQVWDLNNQIAAWIPLPDGFYPDEDYTNRNALVIYPVDTDSLNAAAFYSVYDMEDGYLDLNMDDPLEEDAQALLNEEAVTVTGPSEPVSFDVEDRVITGAALNIGYEPEDGAPSYTTEYMLWTHLDERLIVSCYLVVSSANPESPLPMEEAGRMFLYSVTAE